jgi:hypothetical protein
MYYFDIIKLNTRVIEIIICIKLVLNWTPLNNLLNRENQKEYNVRTIHSSRRRMKRKFLRILTVA